MLCENCGEHEANVKIVKIINGEKSVQHLCEACARKLSDFSMNIADNMSFSLPDFLSGFFNVETIQPTQQGISTKFNQTKTCPKCGLTEAQFAEHGQVGCDQCYRVFRNRLLPLIRRVHGSVAHRGRIPERQGSHLKIQREITNLRQEMQIAIAEERFEDAARVRDRINELKNKLKGGSQDE